MHGVTLTSGPADWEIVQQENEAAGIELSGTFCVHPAALKVGVAGAVPMVRVMREEDNITVVPWTEALKVVREEDFKGTFRAAVVVPSGGLYRIETCLETRSTLPDLTWLYRGDCILHVGVGDLFLIAGQSNSVGYGKDYCTDPPHMCVHLFRNRCRWDLASHPMNESTHAGSLPNVEMGIPGVSPYLSFGKKYYELTGRPVGLIQTALGGSSIARWRPGEGDLYRNLTDKVCLTKGRYAGVLWYQGCEDAKPETAGSYEAEFHELVRGIRGTLGYAIPFFTMQLNRFVNRPFDEAWGTVREAQRRAASSISGVYILPTTNLSLSDSVYNSSQACIALGIRLARQCAHVCGTTEPFEAPVFSGAALVREEEKEALGLQGFWLRLTFFQVKNCFLLYSARGKDSGFTLEDGSGMVNIKRIRANREDKNHVYLEIDREPGTDAALSFAWQADPVRLPLVDEVTWMPPLSFYRVSLEESGGESK